jgi:gluconate 2-dehydrogenase gamma chain
MKAGEGQVTRREAVALLAALPVGLILGCSSDASHRISRVAQQVAKNRASGARFEPKFFTLDEFQTVNTLADMTIPGDERSGSASDAAVPEFMDFMMADQDTTPEARTAMRGGLAWIDAESHRRFGTRFVDCALKQREQLLNDIAWPARARPEMRHGVAFFNSFRDLTASGFWSSEMGVRDLRYQGNTYVPQWTGCPEAALRKLGVGYRD